MASRITELCNEVNMSRLGVRVRPNPASQDFRKHNSRNLKNCAVKDDKVNGKLDKMVIKRFYNENFIIFCNTSFSIAVYPKRGKVRLWLYKFLLDFLRISGNHHGCKILIQIGWSRNLWFFTEYWGFPLTFRVISAKSF